MNQIFIQSIVLSDHLINDLIFLQFRFFATVDFKKVLSFNSWAHPYNNVPLCKSLDRLSLGEGVTNVLRFLIRGYFSFAVAQGGSYRYSKWSHTKCQPPHPLPPPTMNTVPLVDIKRCNMNYTTTYKKTKQTKIAKQHLPFSSNVSAAEWDLFCPCFQCSPSQKPSQ